MEEQESDSLRFVRIFDARKVPEYLLQQIKPRDWSISQFYELNLKRPTVLLYVLVDSVGSVKGFLWLIIDVFNRAVNVIVLSVDRHYQGKGKYVYKALDLIKNIQCKFGLKKISWITTRPKAFEKYGFKRSSAVLM